MGSFPPLRRALRRALCLGLLAAASAALAAGTRAPVPADRGMVVSDHHLASAAGRDVLAAGGNAADAAVATAFALAVVHPAAGNLGGGGFLLHHGAGGEVTSFDFREKAPLAATATLFLDPDGGVRADSNHDGPLAVGVPGTVAGLELAHQRLGSLPWARLVEPAVRLAREGFPVSAELESFMAGLAVVEHPWYTETRRVFLADGRPYRIGELLRQEDLARTLERIRDGGGAGFYSGETARLVAAFMARHGGLVTAEDLARYRARERPPVRGAYRGYDVWGMGPPSSGGIAVIQMLHVLEEFDLATLGHNGVAYVHHVAEAMRRAFADRARHLGDPEANRDLPVERLLSQEYAARLRGTIDPTRASPSSAADFGALYLGAADSEETTHLSVVDGAGAAVALTYTLEESYGSRMTVEGAGFLLNNEMGDFNPVPGETTEDGQIGTEPNLIAPEKRMLSSMSPTIVARDGKVVLVVGSPGGRTIINTVLQVILNVLDHGMNVAEAVAAPRFHHQWLPDEIRAERWGLSPDTLAGLAAIGHRVFLRDAQGRAHAIAIEADGGRRLGAADPRAPNGGAVGH